MFDLEIPDSPRCNNFISVHPVQFVGESTVKALPVRLACPAMRVGDPVKAHTHETHRAARERASQQQGTP
jgi:hypothetical protein